MQALPKELKAASVVDVIVERAVAGGWCGRPARTLIYNNFDHTTSTVLVAIFPPGAGDPEVMVKLSRDSAALEKEFARLRSVSARTRNLAPEPLFLERHGPFGILGMRAVPGRRISSRAGRLARLPVLTERLISLHEAVREGTRPGGELLEDAPRFRDRILRQAAEGERGRAADAFDDMTRRIGAAPLPAIPQHGDFHFDNVLFERNDLRVVDWEDYGEASVPGYDLLCLYLSFFAPWVEGGERTFLEDDVLGERMREGAARYRAAFGIPIETFRAVLTYTLAQQFRNASTLGRSSASRLWQRFSAYLRSPESYQAAIVGEGTP